jgi:DNA (cytosine-5)-methyltransferase 1
MVTSEMRLKEIAFIDLFAGIGGCRIAFEKAGCRCVWSCDWDTDAQKVYEVNFGERPLGDIRKIPTNQIPDHDILVAGFPCPSFSIIGERRGLADNNGSLFFEIERILRDKKPLAFLLENVRDLKNHNKGRTLQTILDHLRNIPYFVHWKILNALDFGLPQKRERIIVVGFQENYEFEFPEGWSNNKKDLKDILEEDEKVPKQFWASERIRRNRAESVKGKQIFYPSIWHENKGGDIGIHPYSCALRSSASYNYLLVNGVRRLTPLEMLKLQGFPDDFKLPVTYTAIRKLIGNSVPIPMIQAVAERMLLSIERDKTLPAVKQVKLLEVS